MYEYACKICPIYSATEPKDVRSILEYANAFRVGETPIIARELVVARYHGLPGAVLAYYEKKYGMTGKAAIKKIHQMMTVAPIKGLTGKNITQKLGIKGLLVDGIWYTLGQVKGAPLMAFNFGLVFVNVSVDEAEKYMKDATAWLPLPVGVEVKII